MPDHIERRILHAIRRYYVKGASPKSFLEDEDCDLTTAEVQEVLDWFNDRLADDIENN